jgi:(1->4)-alpha-D-glucan 1-alpha-D-glucosylmutase
MNGEWVATYRLQLHAGFPLAAAQRVLPYLKDLGISHVYLSPCLQACPGSQHGYDVTDPTHISDDLGAEAAWRGFVEEARSLGLGILLDIVPNHMAASSRNPWWDDVLANGRASRYRGFFDFRIAEDQPFQVQVCALARPYGAALEAGEISIITEGGTPRVSHHDNTWPVNSASRQALPERGAAAQGEVEPPDLTADQLDALLRQQSYRLHGWRLAGELTNYRRFFDIGTLIGVRVEAAEVFEATHARIAEMIAAGDIAGVRVDHPDGLRDPLQYFQRLKGLLPHGRIYVEKILENDERLPEDWPVDGTVGYEFLSKVNRLWMDDQRTDVLTAAYADFTGHSVDLGKLMREMKRDIVESTFSADHEALTAAALALARADWHTCDLSPRHLREALARVIVAMPVYRTYRTSHALREHERRILLEAVQSARSSSPETDAAVFDFLAGLFTKPVLNAAETDFIAKWQQLTPAVMAKGVEDTMFYAFDRLVSCNEVGSQASLVGISADKFHEFCHFLSERWPRTMLATSTHDNKRSEDVRARISILSEIPERWAEALHAWSALTAPAWQNRAPDRHAEYLLYQTLIGAWPLGRERCWQYMLKACREAKINTSWHEPNAGYEEKIRGFVDGLFATSEFLSSLEAFVQPLILPGRINSLAQTLIKMVAPGMPDFYQGSELWDLSLVDPDNRRPVDFARRVELVQRARTQEAADVLADWDSGLPKLWMILRLLSLRRERADDFSAAAKYQPLVAQGSRLGRLLAFRRGENLIAVVPRFTMTLAGDWADTRLPLPGGEWRNHFTNEIVQREVGPDVLFQGFPVALLVRAAA